MARIYALVAALMGSFAQAPAPTTPSVPVRIAPVTAAAETFADARVVVLTGDDRARRRALAGWLERAGAGTTLAVPSAWASPDAAIGFADAVLPHRVGAVPRVFGYRPGDGGASHDALLRFVFEADDDDGRAREVEHALQVGTTRALASVARTLDDRRGAYAARAGRHAFDVARKHLGNLEQLAALRHERYRDAAGALEARFEAENLKWLADHEAVDAPLVVWTA